MPSAYVIVNSTVTNPDQYEDYKKWYFSLAKEFNPTQFNPEAWASSAKNAGMKYLVFTTKHHAESCQCHHSTV